jgi:hypothetical protein
MQKIGHSCASFFQLEKSVRMWQLFFGQAATRKSKEIHPALLEFCGQAWRLFERDYLKRNIL